MRELLLEKIDLSASRLKPYKGFIFLCGGPTDIRSPTPISIRDAIYRELSADEGIERRIRVAEHYKDWSHDGIYRDLVSFEQHLAELSSVIVLVLESPGSIAELGLFSAIQEFKERLLVFIETNHYQSASFIKLGPIDYLEKIYENAAQCDRWTKQEAYREVFDADAAQSLQADFADAVRERAMQATPERRLDPEKWLHRALLACDLLSLCAALTVRELRMLMIGLGVNYTEAELKQLLFLLERVDLVAMEPKGDRRYYVTIDDREHIHLGIRDRNFDTMRFRSDVVSQYEKDDKKRFRAIQDVRRRRAGSRYNN